MNNFFNSMRYALRGVRSVFKNELSFRLQTIAMLFVFVAIALLPLKEWESVALLIMTAAVLVLEILNTVVERIVDMVKPRLHEAVGTIKDMMAAAVLLASFSALVVGAIIVVPYIIAIVRAL